MAAEKQGLDYSDLIERIVEPALERTTGRCFRAKATVAPGVR